MHEGIETLHTIAEIAATFAGFAALAGIIGHFAPEAARMDVERLKTVVIVSVLVVLTALLPAVVLGFGTPEVRAWQLSSGIARILGSE